MPGRGRVIFRIRYSYPWVLEQHNETKSQTRRLVGSPSTTRKGQHGISQHQDGDLRGAGRQHADRHLQIWRRLVHRKLGHVERGDPFAGGHRQSGAAAARNAPGGKACHLRASVRARLAALLLDLHRRDPDLRLGCRGGDAGRDPEDPQPPSAGEPLGQLFRAGAELDNRVGIQVGPRTARTPRKLRRAGEGRWVRHADVQVALVIKRRRIPHATARVDVRVC